MVHNYYLDALDGPQELPQHPPQETLQNHHEKLTGASLFCLLLLALIALSRKGLQ